MRIYVEKALFVLAFVALASGCSKEQPAALPDKSTTPIEAIAPDLEAAEKEAAAEREQFVSAKREEVKAFCADCHVMPRPQSSSREDWVEEVEQGFMLYRTSGRKDLAVPDQEEVLKFFQYQAPDRVELPESTYGYPDTKLSLERTDVSFSSRRPPAVTNVRWIDLGIKDSPAIVYCNINTGAVMAHWPREKGSPTERLATLLQPVSVEPCDLDGDGHPDLIVSDIGEFNANDSDLGRVVWLRNVPQEDRFESIVLREGLSRVADARAGDFDGDGDEDLIVAVFGWRATGQTVLMENTGKDASGVPQFEMRQIDARHGPVDVPPIDLNGDGHLDFVNLISQDYEVVEAFLGDGTGNFKSEVIYQAPDPAYGSSGIELVDMDLDGDMDILFTNGDSFDRGPKPHHSVQWLENEGSFPYTHHHIGLMPGVLGAQAADFDHDGDLDVVAVSLLAGDVLRELAAKDSTSVVMFMQEKDGTFTPTKVEGKLHQHISVEVGDFDEDGRQDFAVGTFLRDGPAQPDLSIWWNRE